MKKTRLFLILLGVSSILFADHPSSIEIPLDDGGLVKTKSFKKNYWVYRSIGGRTEVKGKQKKRKWWCAWLCKRRVKKKAESIVITNTYYSETAPGVFAALERNPKTCSNASSCQQKESALGFVVEIQFLGGLLPIDGVITRHNIVVDGTVINRVTSAGKHPDPGPIIVD